MPRFASLRRTLLVLLLASGSPRLAASAISATPFAARSGPRGATLFTVLPPAHTGIVTENRYADSRMWGDLFPEFTLGSIGTGVAIGDYDNDGRPDLFVVAKTENGRLFRNLGNWKFEDTTERAGLPVDPESAAVWKQGATFADINNDGLLDLYLCRFGAPNLLYVNRGDGTFSEEAAVRGLAVTDASAMAAFCDFDRDGWLDVYVQTNILDSSQHPAGQRDYLFRNRGDGSFANVTDRAGIAGETLGHSATWWDYDRDGWPDLYVANDFSRPDSLYRNNRDGTFTNVLGEVVPHTPHSSMGADLGDIDNDGWEDLLVADMAATTPVKDQRGMAESRLLNKENAEDTTPSAQYMRNALYLNTGTGRCLEIAALAGVAASDWTWSVRFEDLDNDGRVDLHFCNGTVRELHNLDLMARVMRAESSDERIRVMQRSPVLRERNLAYRNLGDMQFAEVGREWGLDQDGVSFGAAFADFDGDGDLDLVQANYESGVTVLRNDSDSGHRLIVALRGVRSNRFGIGARVEIETSSGIQTRTLVLARGYLSSSEPVLHFGLGEEASVRRLTVFWPSGSVQTFENIAADQRLLVTEPATPTPPATGAEIAPPQFNDVTRTTQLGLDARERTLNETAQQPLLPFRQNRRGPAAAVGDLNRDGRDDIVFGGTPASPARLLLAVDGGTFTAIDAAALTAASAANDGPALVFDWDSQGTVGVLVTRSGSALPAHAPGYQPRLLLLSPDGTLSAAPPDTLPALPLSVGAAAAVDFDRDGLLDLFLGGRVVPREYPLPARSALLLNRGGRFEDVTATLASDLLQPGLVTSAIWSDIDGDGWPDLVLAFEWGPVRCWRNDRGRRLVEMSDAAGFASAGSGWWTSLASADFNADGRPDFVAGNAGLNTPYRADPAHPALLFHGDFRGNGTPIAIEALFDGERLRPRRTRSELGAALPAVTKRFPRNDAYASASLNDILGDGPLAQARRFSATELRSGVFLSQPDGTYRFALLPNAAQVAPIQGLAAADFDGDGFADIYALHNSYSPVPSMGRFDGGLSVLLRGDGRGHFTPAPASESGLVVPGDAKALAVLDWNQDGWPDFFITRNRLPSLAMENRGRPARHPLAVRLRGAPGNAAAIGARVELETTDGRRQSAEVFAGSGYFSQASATCFFGWTDAAAPRRVHVRWPHGDETTADVPAGVARFEIALPTTP